MSMSLGPDAVPLADEPKTTASWTSGSVLNAERTAVRVSTQRSYPAAFRGVAK
jgi:hypothetical protein